MRQIVITNVMIRSLACYKGSLRDTTTLFFQFTVLNRGPQRAALSSLPDLFLTLYCVACYKYMVLFDFFTRKGWKIRLTTVWSFFTIYLVNQYLSIKRGRRKYIKWLLSFFFFFFFESPSHSYLLHRYI